MIYCLSRFTLKLQQRQTAADIVEETQRWKQILGSISLENTSKGEQLMSPTTITLLFLAFAIISFILEKIPLGLTATIVALGLNITGVLDTSATFAGYVNSNVILCVGMFVVGQALFETGMANKIGSLVTRFAKSERMLIIAIMIIVGVMSGFLSNTGTAAVLIPVVCGIADESGYSRSRLLMPLVFAAALGGNLSIIGAPGNLMGVNALQEIGESTSFFMYAPVGVPMLVAGILYMAFIGYRFLPDTDLADIKIGDILYLSGSLTTCRDVAHRRVVEEGREIPVDVRNNAILHAGPIIRPLENDKFEMVSVGPTTSMRMEKFEYEFVKTTGVRVIVGKGGMKEQTAAACKDFGCIHVVIPAGNAVVAAVAVEEIERAEWRDLGMPETLWNCRVKEFGPLIVSIDAQGRNYFEEKKIEYNKRKDAEIEKICKEVKFIK